MAVRTKRVFLTLEEFAEWLVPLARELNVAVAVRRGPHEPLQGWDGVAEALIGARWVFLAPSPVDLSRVRADSIVTGQLGWVQLDVPRTDGDRLFQCQFGTKSDWYDSDSGADPGKSGVHPPFRQVLAEMAKALQTPGLGAESGHGLGRSGTRHWVQ